MKKLNKMRSISLLLTLLLAVMMAVPTMSMAAQPTVNLRTTSSFAVLAYSTITNTGGPTTIQGDGDTGGDIGLHPGTAFTEQASVTIKDGDVYVNDGTPGAAVANQAKIDLGLAYDLSLIHISEPTRLGMIS